MSFLTVICGLDQGKAFPLDEKKSPYVLGRSEKVSVILKDAGISREHAELYFKKDQWHLKDKNSRNGSYLNGLPTNDKSLHPQDVISLGSVELMFHKKVAQSPSHFENFTAGPNTTDAFDLSRRIGKSIIGQSSAVKKMIDEIWKMSLVETTVLIRGDTGTGKELVARALHGGSERRIFPFVAVNCAAIPENLFESEFFGHIKGAFTGADREHLGYFEQSHQGSIFLDEIGDLPLEAQAKLLRVLETQNIRPVGATEDRRLDLRVIAASHRDLFRLVQEKSFREDLFHRLKVVEIKVPALKQRVKDIPLLSDYFLTRLCHERSRKVLEITESAMKILLAYDWPGNIRELKNVLERAMILAGDENIKAEHLPALSFLHDLPNEKNFKTLKEFEQEQAKTHIQKALQLANGNKSKAAKLLGISRPVLYDRLKVLKLD